MIPSFQIYWFHNKRKTLCGINISDPIVVSIENDHLVANYILNSEISFCFLGRMSGLHCQQVVSQHLHIWSSAAGQPIHPSDQISVSLFLHWRSTTNASKKAFLLLRTRGLSAGTPFLNAWRAVYPWVHLYLYMANSNSRYFHTLDRPLKNYKEC